MQDNYLLSEIKFPCCKFCDFPKEYCKLGFSNCKGFSKGTENSTITIEIKKLSKKRSVTLVSGLVGPNDDGKEIQKKLAVQFAAGVTLEKGILRIQGDLTCEIDEWIEENIPNAGEIVYKK